jgi:NAD-dependent SIR2 family protein deacetylase
MPDYRDADGSWKRTPPVRFQAFIAHDAIRRRYWARSMIGWRRFGQAQPNDAHFALARLEASGRSRMLLTQNVDRLHQAAGSREVIDLHGRLDLVRCLVCIGQSGSDARRRSTGAQGGRSVRKGSLVPSFTGRQPNGKLTQFSPEMTRFSSAGT